MLRKAPDFAQELFITTAPSNGDRWTEIQDRLALNAGMSLLIVEGPQPPELVVSNNNSICHAIQSSPEHAELCAPYCGAAHARAQDSGSVDYLCHAGLSCFAKPIQIGERKDLAVIGGRAFLEIADYQKTIDRFRNGDLKDLFSERTFSSVLFGTGARLELLASAVERSAHDFSHGSADDGSCAEHGLGAKQEQSQSQLEEENARLRTQVEHQTRVADSVQYFLNQISSANPVDTYVAVLMNSKDLLRADRASLLVYDEATNELTVKAAVGIPVELADVSSVKLGEGIAGETLQTKRPLMVADLEAAGLQPAPPERLYKTNSFISYPITIAGRRVGVLNVTDKTGGGKYDEVDLSMLDIVAPQVALALERAEWQEKASQFQLMSITDPLTGLQNRRYMEERLAEEVNRSRRYEQPLSFLMIDIDDFKHYNDRNGHQAGDVALQITAQELRASLRSADIASRYGGEEFCVLLPQTTLPEAGVIAERMREKIGRTPFPHAASQPFGSVTLSIGVSTFSPSIDTPEKIIWAADGALYDAKKQGKNTIAFHDVGYRTTDK